MKTTIEQEEDEFGEAPSGRGADELDAASRIESMSRHEAVTEFRRRLKPEHPILEKDEETGLYPGRDCDDCGDPLEQHRLESGRARCVPCQELKEHKEKRNGR